MKPTDLVQFGLNEKEAAVYLAALELGSATVQQIAQKAGLKRPTAYVIIRSLIDKGLMSSFYQNKKQRFVAENPDRLHLFLESQKRSMEDKKTELQKFLPQLKSIYNVAEGKPVVRFFEGKKGLLTMSEEFLESGAKEAVMVYSDDLVQKVFQPTERTPAKEKRLEKGIKVRSIYTSSTRELADTETSKKAKVSQGRFPITCDIAIFGNKVRVASLGDKLSGVVIEDKNIAETLKSIFDLAWEAAEKYKDKKKD